MWSLSFISIDCKTSTLISGYRKPTTTLLGHYTIRYSIIWSIHPVILLSGYYATRYLIIWYYATRYPIIWVLCNSLFYYLGTMQPAICCFLGTTCPYFLWLWYYLTQHINIFSGSIHPFLFILGYYATHSYYWVLCNPVILILGTMHPGFSLVWA